MTTANKYERYAEECAGWAADAKSNRERQIYTQMAEAWGHIALIERDIARHIAFDAASETAPRVH